MCCSGFLTRLLTGVSQSILCIIVASLFSSQMLQFYRIKCNFIYAKIYIEIDINWIKLQKKGATSDELELGIYCQGRGPE